MDKFTDLFSVKSWGQFAFFMAASAWVAFVGVASFWCKYRISSPGSKKEAQHKSRTNSHFAAVSHDPDKAREHPIHDK